MQTAAELRERLGQLRREMRETSDQLVYARWAEAHGIDPAEIADEPLDPFDDREAAMTVREAAAMLGVGEEQVRRLLRSNRLIGVNQRGRAGYLVSRRSVVVNKALREEGPMAALEA